MRLALKDFVDYRRILDGGVFNNCDPIRIKFGLDWKTSVRSKIEIFSVWDIRSTNFLDSDSGPILDRFVALNIIDHRAVILG